MNKGSILILEDQLIIAEDLSITLREKGYNVVGTVLSIEEAIEKCRETRPELVLVDLNLHKTGLILATSRLIREQFNVPVIFLTTDCQDSLSAFEAASPCVSKPFSEKELCALVEIVLNDHRRNQK
jgi:DNA-binding response OmpR family regulator